uniref:Uncharacterized protein n=1 Tax=Medicago truncatula TaxID=3880 RepID=I3SGC4_MEDTR|nr:unknown [Medicago truncatula]
MSTSSSEPFKIGTMLRAAPLTTRRKSLLRPTYLAYFSLTGASLSRKTAS